MVKFLRFLLLPFSLVFGLVVVVRNFLYDRGLIKSCAFDLPVIVVGNLEVGGSGKTPVIEYLIRLLNDCYRIAVLSRGYGRSGSGFTRTVHEAVCEITALLMWDATYQYFSRL